jgi:hypothetical protein
MADDVTASNSAPADTAIDPAKSPGPALDAPAVAADSPAPAGPASQTAEAVKVEEKALTKDEQALETDRAEADKNAEGGSNRPSIEPSADNSAVARLRAFEDQVFGPDAVRINGQVERGSGSRFQQLTAPQRRHYEALEALRPAELRLAEAAAELTAAETAHEAALSRAEKTSEEI